MQQDQTSKARRAPFASPKAKQQAHQMYLAGHKGREIAQTVGVHESVVSQWVCRNNWKVQRDALMATTTKLVTSKANELQQDLIVRHQTRIHEIATGKIDSLAAFPADKSSDFESQANALRKLDDVVRRNLGLDIGESKSAGGGNLNLFLGSHELQPTPVSQAIEAEIVVEETKGLV